MKAAKEELIEQQCKNIEKGTMSGNSKEAYNTEDSSGHNLTESTAVLNRWTEYCSGL